MLLYNEDLLDIFDQAYNILNERKPVFDAFSCIGCLDTMEYMMTDVDVEYQASVIDKMIKGFKADQEAGYEDGYSCFMNGHADVLDDAFKRIKGPYFVRGWEAGYFDAQEDDREYDKIGC